MNKKNVNIGIEARYHYFMRLKIGIKAMFQDYFMFFSYPAYLALIPVFTFFLCPLIHL